MAAIGRALMANPRVLLCDEISLGLAPIVIRNIYAALPRIKASGASVILVEQDIVQALAGGGPRLLLPGGAHVAHGPARRARPRPDPHGVFRRMTAWVNTLLQGVMLGGLYALFAAGLSLIFGIMRLVNLAHGDFIVLAAFVDPGAEQSPRASIRSSPRCSPRRILFGLGYAPAALPAQPHARPGHSAAAARHLRALHHHPERAARGLLRRQPAPQGRRHRDRLDLRSAAASPSAPCSS